MTEGRWLLLLEQEEEGCDYSIGCGMTTHELGAAPGDGAAALREAEGFIRGGDAGDDEDDCESWLGEVGQGGTLASALLIEVHSELPLGRWRSVREEKRARERALKKEAEERAELERLQAKFGK